jgi:hypothetical protein
LLENRLQDVSVRVGEIALHGVHHGVAVALMIAQVNTGMNSGGSSLVSPAVMTIMSWWRPSLGT